MGPYEPHVNNAVGIIDPDDEPVLVPADIEHDSASLQNTRVSVSELDVGWGSPVRVANLCVPVLQGTFRVGVPGVAFPKEPKGTLRDDPHAGNGTLFPIWEQAPIVGSVS